jgi:membrane-bound metal-dependent hydrolase YbcI (DUF457 family)
VIYYRRSGIKVELPDLIIAAAIGFVGGLLPDLLEPASNPNHRKFAHSILVAIGLFVVIGLIWRSSESISDEQRLALGSMVVAYLSHLMMDSTTPKCIPLIG